MTVFVGPFAALAQAAAAYKFRRAARRYALQAEHYYRVGQTAPALLDDLLDVHRRAANYDGGQWPA